MLFFFRASLLSFSLLLLLLSVCDDIADVLVVYVASNIWGEGGPQVLHLLWGESVALGGQELLQEFLLDGASTLGVEDLEGTNDNVLGISTLQLLAEHGEEDGEVDGARGLLDHGLKLLILHVQLAH